MGGEMSSSRNRSRRIRYRRNRPRPVYDTESESEPELENGNVPPFHVTDVDFNQKKNRKDHHTSDYKEHKELIIRRGQEFKIDVTVDKKFEKGEDVIMLQFKMGKNPKESKGTMFIITAGDSSDADDARATIDDVDSNSRGSTIRMSVTFPSDCVVGRFTLRISMRNKEDKGDDKKFTKHKVEETIIVLFNPWCKDDTVYVDDEDEREEYVLNTTGFLYKGTSRRTKQPSPRNWSFGQFDKESLDATMYLMDQSDLPWAGYGNPVRVTRCLSAMINSSDDNGVLTGNWSGDYAGGTPPSRWTGSVRILEQYMRTKEPVLFGQCWVFSGLITTVCRALGLPTRSVTNYSSAHDCDASITIDYHENEDGDKVKSLNDSIWNFHVWNEAWFKRPDLPDGYDGWQAFDATPQETSSGKYRCGPAPLSAIKNGNVHIGDDTKFIFSEVNGDKATWLVNRYGKAEKVLRVDKKTVGKTISTKAVGKRERNDITDMYKVEGGEEAEMVREKVTQQACGSRRKALKDFHEKDENPDVNMQFDCDMSENADARFEFRAENKSQEERTILVKIHVMAKYYTGTEGNDIDYKRRVFKLGPLEKDEINWTIKAEDWLNKIPEDATIGVYVNAKVKETGQVFIDDESFDIEKDELDVTVSKSSVKAWEEVDVTIKFKNPLDIPITGASFSVEGAGISNNNKIDISGEIGPNDTVKREITVIPKIPGKREIIASFHSRQLVNIDGTADITVLED